MKMKIQMHQKYDELTGFLAGLVGGGLTIHLMDITWKDIFNNAGQLVWVGFVALFTGLMGVLGKHVASSIIKRYKNRKK